ncbi:MAG: sucrase ferredoxin [Cyanobacteria bacterium P01_C01_bin.121]
MKPSFCAIANQQTGEDLIGTAGHYQTYVLIECPRPWAAKVFTSEKIPANLRDYVKSIKAQRSIQFLAISRGDIAATESVTVMVYERTLPSDVALSKQGSASRESIHTYRGYEFQLDSLSQVVGCLEAHWQGDRIGQPITQKDILICTHGMRDKCCARFGHTFFREAARSVKQGRLPSNTRIWKVSHIGGHRFAPTAISLPDGRYYGRLTIEALEAIMTRSGSVNQLSAVYRGWGLLPSPLQVLERQLILTWGWSWFDCTVNYQILTDSMLTTNRQARSETSPNETLSDETPQKKRLHEISVEISVVLTDTSQATYRTMLVQDPDKTVYTKASCNSAVPVPITKYTVTECTQVKSQAADIRAADTPVPLAVSAKTSSKASSPATS